MRRSRAGSNGVTTHLPDLAGAVFEQENMPVYAAASESFGTSRVADPNFDAWESIKATKCEPYFERFIDAPNAPLAEAIKRDIGREEENRNIVDAAPLCSHAGNKSSSFRRVA